MTITLRLSCHAVDRNLRIAYSIAASASDNSSEPPTPPPPPPATEATTALDRLLRRDDPSSDDEPEAGAEERVEVDDRRMINANSNLSSVCNTQPRSYHEQSREEDVMYTGGRTY